jgi:alpha-beta hydrolase superfamily lysophospholipase
MSTKELAESHKLEPIAPRDVTVGSSDGQELRGSYWPHPAPRSVLVIAHGFGEHGGCYEHVARALGPALELDVVAFDQRGHGRSAGRRGVVREFMDLAGDVAAGLAWAASERPGLPRYLLGHSNGGLLALVLALTRASGAAAPAGLILSNPALRVATPVPALKLLIGRLLEQLAPWVTLSGSIDASQMTRDPEFQRAHETDPLRHDRISAPLYFGMKCWGETIAASAPSIGQPVLMLLGGSDPVIDVETSRRFFERLGSADKALHLYPPMLHEPLNEVDRAQVFADIAAWLRPRLAGSSETG